MKMVSWKDSFDYDELSYGYIPSAWLEKLEQLDSIERQEKWFFDKIEERKIDIDAEIESLNDDLLQFKAFGLRYKKELDKIYNEQFKQFEKIWEDNNISDKTSNVIADIKHEIDTISDNIKQFDTQIVNAKCNIINMNNEIDNLNLRKLKKVVNLLDKINNMSKEDKEILKLIVNNKE